jgi:hypothetical protein
MGSEWILLRKNGLGGGGGWRGFDWRRIGTGCRLECGDSRYTDSCISRICTFSYLNYSIKLRASKVNSWHVIMP